MRALIQALFLHLIPDDDAPGKKPAAISKLNKTIDREF